MKRSGEKHNDYTHYTVDEMVALGRQKGSAMMQRLAMDAQSVCQVSDELAVMQITATHLLACILTNSMRLNPNLTKEVAITKVVTGLVAEIEFAEKMEKEGNATMYEIGQKIGGGHQ